jgi:Zn-dependent protease with chaperone function
MDVVNARLFGPGLPPAGQDCTWQRASGLISWPQGRTRVPAAAGEVRVAGFDLQGVELAWQDTRNGAGAQGRWAMQVLAAAEAARVRAAPPAGWEEAFARLADNRRARRGRLALGWFALLLFLALPLLLVLGFFLAADDLAGWAAGRVSVKQEVALGEASFAAMKPRMKLRDDGEAAAALRELGARLTKGSAYRYGFHLVEDASINAFAIPGGIVVVHSGLLAATRSPEELAGVLAHEVQHVELRHSLKSIMKQMGLSAVWAMASGDLAGAMTGKAAQHIMGLKFSRDAEREADASGLDALLRAGIDPAGMPAFFATLEKAGAAPPALLSTHPASDARREALAARLQALGSRTFEPLPYRHWPPAL